ncbi:MAG: superoxide dismutase family protein [Burkholderiales bacterium]|nr:superoxide dismutase family protein [Burkholderiales bacterium]
MFADIEFWIVAVLATCACLWTTHSHAETVEATMYLVDEAGTGAAIGKIVAVDSPDGVTFTPALEGLPPGKHGFHVHEKPSCAPAQDPAKGKAGAAMAAGSHLDPNATKRHRGPQGEGHLGDLPILEVDDKGRSTIAVQAPRLRLADLTGRALIIHAGADTYSDEPEKLGGGGDRIACGVIKAVRTTRCEELRSARNP